MRTKLARYMVNLEHFATVVEYGNISAAASVLAISQSALTRSIMRLEDVLGAQLLHRSVRGVAATECGFVLLQHIAAVKAELDRALTSVQVAKGGMEGKINCGAGSVSMNRILPHAVSKIRKKYNKVQVNLVEGRTQDLLTKLRNGELDVVIGIEQPDSLAVEFHIDKLIQEHFDFYVRSDHPDAARQSSRLADIVGSDKFVMPVLAASPVEKAFASELERLDCSMSPHGVETLSLAVMRHLVLSDDYVAFSSSLLFESEIRARQVRALRGDWAFPAFTTCVFRRRGDVLNPMLLYFIEQVKQAAAECEPEPAATAVR